MSLFGLTEHALAEEGLEGEGVNERHDVVESGSMLDLVET